MGSKKTLGLRNMRPLIDPTGVERKKYLLALDEGWLCWGDVFLGAPGCAHGVRGVGREIFFVPGGPKNSSVLQFEGQRET